MKSKKKTRSTRKTTKTTGSTKVDSPSRAKQKRLLEAYAQLGTITHAAESAGVDRAMHYRWIDTDDQYGKEFQAASDRFVDLVRNAVRHRAIDGWTEPIVYKGEIQYVEMLDKSGRPVRMPVTVLKFSDRLLELLAKGKVPELKDKLELGAGGSIAEIIARSYEDGKRKA